MPLGWRWPGIAVRVRRNPCPRCGTWAPNSLCFGLIGKLPQTANFNVKATTWNKQRRNAGILHCVQNDDVKQTVAHHQPARVSGQVLRKSKNELRLMKGLHSTLRDEAAKDGAPVWCGLVETHVPDAGHGAPGFVATGATVRRADSGVRGSTARRPFRST
jgi:hypothetical protein